MPFMSTFAVNVAFRLFAMGLENLLKCRVEAFFAILGKGPINCFSAT